MLRDEIEILKQTKKNTAKLVNIKVTLKMRMQAIAY